MCDEYYKIWFQCALIILINGLLIGHSFYKARKSEKDRKIQREKWDKELQELKRETKINKKDS